MKDFRCLCINIIAVIEVKCICTKPLDFGTIALLLFFTLCSIIFYLKYM